jgi:hypothetical protein
MSQMYNYRVKSGIHSIFYKQSDIIEKSHKVLQTSDIETNTNKEDPSSNQILDQRSSIQLCNHYLWHFISCLVNKVQWTKPT